jgi:Uma2 family endonuclease
MRHLANIEDLMKFEEFTQFVETRPEKEKWELIDGVPVLNASPNFAHQIIVRNIIGIFRDIERDTSPKWTAIPGIGVRLSGTNAAEPDAMIRPLDNFRSNYCDDMIVGFEALSPSTAKRDLTWKRDAYSKLPSLAHYVIVAPDEVKVFVYSRADKWAERKFTDIGKSLLLGAIGAELKLADIYKDLLAGF